MFRGPDGNVEESGTFQDPGMETLNYSDGTAETVNVDTADTSTDSNGSAVQSLRRPHPRL